MTLWNPPLMSTNTHSHAYTYSDFQDQLQNTHHEMKLHLLGITASLKETFTQRSHLWKNYKYWIHGPTRQAQKTLPSSKPPPVVVLVGWTVAEQDSASTCMSPYPLWHISVVLEKPRNHCRYHQSSSLLLSAFLLTALCGNLNESEFLSLFLFKFLNSSFKVVTYLI